jgi:regulator of cell morphogenesis and NO signaling
MPATLQRTIGELVAERPARARVFEGFHIDYCCGGKKPLADACQAKGIDPQVVLDMLALVDDSAPPHERDWTQATITELCDNIESTHHVYLKENFPRLEFFARKVANRHGDHFPDLIALRDTVLAMKDEMETHMLKEEQILFPLCRKLDRGDATATHGRSVKNPIRVMMQEHDDTGAALEKIRELTNGFVPPQEACNTFRAYYDALAELERDMHRHVHKENSLLFPKAIEAEQRLAQR